MATSTAPLLMQQQQQSHAAAASFAIANTALTKKADCVAAQHVAGVNKVMSTHGTSLQ